MIKLNTVAALLCAGAAFQGAATVQAQIALNLPEPIFLETFDQTQEGALPAGWTVENFTDENTPGLDLDNPDSDSYRDWVVISRDRLLSVGTAGGWDAGHRLNVVPGQFVNGVEVTSLVQGNFIYAESDSRSGNQVQYLFSPDIDCSGKTNVHLAYFSVYTQNQDSIGAVEYSIDGGATWLPVLYMIDRVDIVQDAGGNIDAEAALTTERSDAARYFDPVTGEEKGGHYGAFIGVVPEQWSTLGAFISGRIDDDSAESKRVEYFRLPQADNQARVRLRFAQAGTASWYFGLDNVGLYSVAQGQPPKITSAPESQVVSAGAVLTLSVTAEGEGVRYQWTFNGANLPGQTNATLTISGITAEQAGDYQVLVSDSQGSAPSPVAKVEVIAGPITSGLVAHLKFENDFADASGKGLEAIPVGAPSFSEGKIGAAALHIPSGGDYVSLGAPPDLNFTTNIDFSISFWAKLVDWSSDPAFVSNKDWNGGGNQGWVIATDGDGRLQWNLGGPPGSRKDYDGPGGTFSDNNWHHVAVTFKRTGDATTFVDGQTVNVTAINTSENDLDTSIDFATNIGQDGSGFYGPSFFDADLDDLGIWRRVLSVQEVIAIYNAGLTGKDLSQATVSAPAIAPRITAEPQSVAATAGATAAFSVTVEGSQPLTYQWKVNGTDIPGATAPALTLTNVQPANAGAYTVVVTNAAGSATSAAANLTINAAPPSVVTGQWDFDAGNLNATVGAPLEFRGGTEAGTTFTEMPIGGSAAKVMGFPATTADDGFIMTHGAAPNGGGSAVNQFTIIWDLYYPAESDGLWRALLQTDPSNTSDSDLFINTANGLGISSQYQGTILPETWHRVGAVFDLASRTLKKYVDGNLVNVQNLGDSGGVDQRWSLLPTALLFADEDGETAAGFVNGIQFRQGLMTDEEISALGGATAGGIPQPQAAVQLAVASRSGNQLTLSWSGGTGPFTVQRKAALTDAAWTTVATTTESTATVTMEGQTGFFRVSAGAQ